MASPRKHRQRRVPLLSQQKRRPCLPERAWTDGSREHLELESKFAKAGGFQIIRPASFGRWMAFSGEHCWLVTTVAAVARSENLEFATNALAQIVLTSDHTHLRHTVCSAPDFGLCFGRSVRASPSMSSTRDIPSAQSLPNCLIYAKIMSATQGRLHISSAKPALQKRLDGSLFALLGD